MSSVHAEDRFAVEAFEPAPDVSGSVLNVYGARTVRPRAYSLGVFGSYGRKPLSIESATTGKVLGELTGSIGTLTVLGTVGLWKHLDLGVALPIHRVSRGSDFVRAPSSVPAAVVDPTRIGLGDLRLVPRVTLLPRGAEHGLALALLTQVFVPTGKDSIYAGEPLRVEPRVALDWRTRGGALYAFNAGYMIRRPATVLGHHIDDMLRAGVGVDLPVALGFSALAEVDTQLNVLSTKFARADAPTSSLLGLRYRHSGFLAQAGAGPSLVRGFGAARYRVFASLTYEGHLEPDSDGDGLLDRDDACPQAAEDKDGFEDKDGCPDLDDDHDGVPDAHDKCPREAEDRDGFEDDDGCVDADNDGDHVPDVSDLCPGDAEDEDGFADQDGCPEHDNDGDGIADVNDHCPDAAGTAELDGCPPPPQVVVTEKVIELRSPLFFAKNRAELQDRSLPMIEEIASVMQAHPEILLVVVEGHTDDSGRPKHNRYLSAGRAAAVVQALVKHGVSAKRLRSMGFGPDQPLVPNDSDENRATNRRVELRIESRAP